MCTMPPYWEYRYAYGAVEPLTGESFFLIMPSRDTDRMNIFLKELSAAYPGDYVILSYDGAAWHKSAGLEIPQNIKHIFIPTYTPEMTLLSRYGKSSGKEGSKMKSFLLWIRSLTGYVLLSFLCLRRLLKALPEEIGF